MLAREGVTKEGYRNKQCGNLPLTLATLKNDPQRLKVDTGEIGLIDA